jgi:flagellar biogenesis protein FliO
LSPYGSYVLETVVTLIAVSLFAFVLLFAARRAGLGQASGSVDLVGRLPLDARRSVVLVKVGEQVFVVGVSEAGLTKLGEMKAADVPTAPPRTPPSFADALRTAIGVKRPPKGEGSP